MSLEGDLVAGAAAVHHPGLRPRGTRLDVGRVRRRLRQDQRRARARVVVRVDWEALLPEWSTIRSADRSCDEFLRTSVNLASVRAARGQEFSDRR